MDSYFEWLAEFTVEVNGARVHLTGKEYQCVRSRLAPDSRVSDGNSTNGQRKSPACKRGFGRVSVA
jgi:hypothetical protein